MTHAQDVVEALNTFKVAALSRISAIDSLAKAEELRSEIFGKTSPLHTTSLALASAAPKDKPVIGQALNTVKKCLEDAWKAQAQKYKKTTQHAQLDLTLPAAHTAPGSTHLTTLTIQRIARIFSLMGFQQYEGPEVEESAVNFDALNIPPFHPARSMQDTFYISQSLLLRTHTSNAQIRALKNMTPPLRIISPGRVFRADADATHSPMFHQIEGLVIERHVSFTHLVWTLKTFLSLFFEKQKISFRIRPSYFPFTQPSAEVDIAFADGTFLEVLGCGMVHPHVLKNMGCPPELKGFAFGLGVERMAMLRNNIRDLRPFFESDQRWLRAHTQPA